MAFIVTLFVLWIECFYKPSNKHSPVTVIPVDVTIDFCDSNVVYLTSSGYKISICFNNWMSRQVYEIKDQKR